MEQKELKEISMTNKKKKSTQQKNLAIYKILHTMHKKNPAQEKTRAIYSVISVI